MTTLARHAPYDLFGEVPVLLDDVLARMLAVPGIAPDSMRFAPHIRDYDVTAKIRPAKAAGTFDDTVNEMRPHPVRLAAAFSAANSRPRGPARAGTRAHCR